MAEKKVEKFMTFGPDWLHNLSQETSSVPATTSAATAITPPAVNIAVTTNNATSKEPVKSTSLKNRYGREEMLALFDGNASIPKDVNLRDLLFVNKVQLPVALQALTTSGEAYSRRSWLAARNANPRMVPPDVEATAGRAYLRPRNRGVFYTPEHMRNPLFSNGPGVRGGLGRSVDVFETNVSRNMGRNGMTIEYEDWETMPNPRKDMAHAGRWGNDANWRRTYPKGPEDEDGWRGGSGENPRARPHYLGKKLSWREDEAENIFRFDRERGFPEREWSGDKRERGSVPWLGNRKSWVGESHSPDDHLPEWANAENAFGPSGTFDSSGAFHGGADDAELEPPKQNTLTHSQSSTAPFSSEKKTFLSRGHTQGSIQLNKTKIHGGAPGLRGPLLRASSEDLASNSYSSDISKAVTATYIDLMQRKSDQPEDAKEAADIKETKPEVQNKENPPPLAETKNGTRGIENKNNTPRPVTPESFDDVMTITDRQKKDPTVIQQKNSKKIEAIAPKIPPSNNQPVKIDVSQPPPAVPNNTSNAEVFTEYPMIKDIVKMFVLEEEDTIENKTKATVPPGNRPFMPEKPQIPPLAAVNPPVTPLIPPGTKIPEPNNAFGAEALPDTRYRPTETWYYRDPQGDVQGPFTSVEMTEWFETGYFSDNLCIRKGDDNFYITLGFLKSMCRGSPFNLGSDATDLVFKVAESITNYRNKKAAMSPEENALYDARQSVFTSAQEKLYKESLQKEYMMKQQLLYEQMQQAHTPNLQPTPMGVIDQSPLDMQYTQQLPPGVEQHCPPLDCAMDNQWLPRPASNVYPWRGPPHQSNSPSPVQFQMAASHLNQLQLQAMVGPNHQAMMGNMNTMPLLRAGPPPMMHPPIMLPPVPNVAPIPSSIWENQNDTKQPILLEQLYSSINQQHPSTLLQNQNHSAMMMELMKNNQYKNVVDDSSKQHTQLQSQHLNNPLLALAHNQLSMAPSNLLPNAMQQNSNCTLQLQQMLLSQQQQQQQQPPSQKPVAPPVEPQMKVPEVTAQQQNLTYKLKNNVQIAQRVTTQKQVAKSSEPTSQKDIQNQPKTKPTPEVPEVKSAAVNKTSQSNGKLTESVSAVAAPGKVKIPDEKQKKKEEVRAVKEQKEVIERPAKPDQSLKQAGEAAKVDQAAKTKKKKEEKVKVVEPVAEPTKKKKAQVVKETQEKVETPKKAPAFISYPKESVPQPKNTSRAAPWCPKDVQSEITSSMSLADIQRLEREQKSQQTRDLVMLLAERQAAATAKELKDSNKQSAFTWANQKRKQPNKVMNLTDIQAEEQLQVSISHKQAEKDNSANAAAVGSSGLSSSQSNPNIWGVPVATVPWWQSPNTGFWDTPSSDIKEASKKNVSETVTVSSSSNKTQTPATVRPAKNDTKVVEQKPSASKKTTPKPAAPAGKSVCSSVANSDALDEFLSWAKTTLSKMGTDIDVATFVVFLMNVEAPYEVKEYIKYYFGDGKEATEFARQFIEKRSRILRLNTTSVPSDDLCSPAPAVNPSMGSMDFQDAKFKKTKKNKMLKIDSRNLGFNVTAAADRFNIGDIHSV